MKRIFISLVASIIGVLLATTVYNYRAHQQRLRLELQQTQQQKQELDNKLKDSTKQIEDLQQVKQDLEVQLQSKRQKQLYEAQLASYSKIQVTMGDWVTRCQAWAAQAGITLDASAIKLLERESHCSPTVCNANGVACGIPQALPWTKMGCELSVADAPCQLRWFQNYVIGKYGSYANALAHSYAYNWY